MEEESEPRVENQIQSIHWIYMHMPKTGESFFPES